MGFSTVGKIVKEAVEAVWDVLQPLHMPAPKMEDFIKISRQYYNVWNFPHCIGAIDGKHVKVTCPPNSGSMYFNYKHFFSIVLLAIADADYRFIMIDVGGFGKQSDAGIFRNSPIFKLLQTQSHYSS